MRGVGHAWWMRIQGNASSSSVAAAMPGHDCGGDDDDDDVPRALANGEVPCQLATRALEPCQLAKRIWLEMESKLREFVSIQSISKNPVRAEIRSHVTVRKYRCAHARSLSWLSLLTASAFERYC